MEKFPEYNEVEMEMPVNSTNSIRGRTILSVRARQRYMTLLAARPGGGVKQEKDD